MALRAFGRRQLTTFIGTKAIVEAIIYVGNAIAYAVSTDASASAPKIENLNKLLDFYKDLLLPDEAEKKEDQAKKMEKVFKEEIHRGPFKVQSMMASKKGKKKRG